MTQILKLSLITLTVMLTTSCIGHDVRKIANEYCECREVEKFQGTLQGTKCIEEWDQKYGKIELNESQQRTLLEILKECNPK